MNKNHVLVSALLLFPLCGLLVLGFPTLPGAEERDRVTIPFVDKYGNPVGFKQQSNLSLRRPIVGRIEILTNTSSIPVYRKNTTSTRTVGRLKDGDIVPVFQISETGGEEWFEVEYAIGRSGWIACANYNSYITQWVGGKPSDITFLAERAYGNSEENRGNGFDNVADFLTGKKESIGILDIPFALIELPFRILGKGAELVMDVFTD